MRLRAGGWEGAPMWFRSVVAGLIVSILLLFGCGEDAEETTDDTEDQQTYVTESQIAFVSYRIVS